MFRTYQTNVTKDSLKWWLWSVMRYLSIYKSSFIWPRSGLCHTEVSNPKFSNYCLFFTPQLKNCCTFFWYELDPNLKLIWKGIALKFNIGGINVEKNIPSTSKLTAKLTYNNNNKVFCTWRKLKSSTFTPPLLKLSARCI